MNSIHIRKCKESDTQTCRDLLKANELPIEINKELFTHYFVAESQENSIIGAIGLESDGRIGLLRSLVVDSMYRGIGIGHQLVSTLEEYAKMNQISKLFLLTTTTEGFFIEIGYSTFPKDKAPTFIKKTSEFSSICPETAICMQKIIESEKNE